MKLKDKNKEFEAALEKAFSNLNDKDEFELAYDFDVDEYFYRITIRHVITNKYVLGKVDFETEEAEKVIEDMLATLKEVVDEKDA